MGIATGLTKERMLEIEAASVVGGSVDGSGHLILEKFDGGLVDAGNVVGPQGDPGAPGTPAPVTTAIRDPTNASDAPSSFIQGLTIGDAGIGMPVDFATVETFFVNINRGVQRVTHKDRKVVWTRTAVDNAWTEWDVQTLSGTTFSRDVAYPPPTTDAERVALANKKPVWFNTDKGWEESYYATTGLTGLTVPGLDAAVASGWYPTGPGPYIVLEPTAAFVVQANQYVGNWHNGNMRRKGGSAIFVPDSSGFIQVLLSGYYDVKVATLLTNGSGTANFHLRTLNSALTTTKRQIDGLAFTLVSNLAVRMHGEDNDAPIYAGDKVGLFCHSGSNLSVHHLTHTPRGQFAIRYKGPMLVSD